MQYQVFDQFFKQAKEMRATFDKKFADPLNAHGGRFVWDFWHVPDEYTHLRTPAFEFFTPRLYERFHRHLVEWGRSHLGCHDISPPWLSCYIEGCRQQPHRDVPHGPLAFVYSLTPWQGRAFKGGETFIQTNGRRPIIIPSLFNRLLVFNPSLVHGVKEVRGTMDPREGRLVIHGWFVNPRPFWYGPLTASDVSRSVERGLKEVLSGQLNLGRGLISLRLSIAASGKVRSVVHLVNTLSDASEKDLALLIVTLKQMQFPAKRVSTKLTLPLMIE